jgi:hypothetical protein
MSELVTMIVVPLTKKSRVGHAWSDFLGMFVHMWQYVTWHMPAYQSSVVGNMDLGVVHIVSAKLSSGTYDILDCVIG